MYLDDANVVLFVVKRNLKIKADVVVPDYFLHCISEEWCFNTQDILLLRPCLEPAACLSLEMNVLTTSLVFPIFRQ